MLRTSTFFATLLIPYCALNEILASPLAPAFVVIRTTPFAAREPYIAAEDASLRICMLSISLGARNFKLSTGTPSTTYKGSLLPLNDVVPRTLIDISPPGAPDGCITDTPAALPCSACAAETIGRWSRSFVETVETAVVTSLRFTEP